MTPTPMPQSPRPHALPHARTGTLERLHAHTHTLTSMYHSGAQPAPGHPQSRHTDPRCTHSQSHAYSWVLPSPPPRADPRVEQKPCVPSSPSPLTLLSPSPLTPPHPPTPVSVHPLCPPAVEPERESRQSGRDIAPRLSGVQGGRTNRSGQCTSSSCREPGRGHGQVSARYIWGLRMQDSPGCVMSTSLSVCLWVCVTVKKKQGGMSTSRGWVPQSVSAPLA